MTGQSFTRARPLAPVLRSPSAWLLVLVAGTGHSLTVAVAGAYEKLVAARSAAFRLEIPSLFETQLRQQFRQVRQCLAPEASGCVYALRQAVAVGVAAEIYRRTGLQSGYWIPMTALLVLQRDFHQTVVRGMARLSGTLLGVGIGGAIAAFLRPSPVALSILVLLFAWLAIAVTNVNYALCVLNLTTYIVFLLALAGSPPADVVHRRALCTAVGGALALFAHLDILRRTNLRRLRTAAQPFK